MTEQEYEIVTARAQVDMIRLVLRGFVPPADLIASQDVILVRQMLNAWHERLYAEQMTHA
jgi:hypothetical protein